MLDIEICFLTDLFSPFFEVLVDELLKSYVWMLGALAVILFTKRGKRISLFFT